MDAEEKKRRRKFTKEFKEQAVKLLETRQKGARELEEELGIRPGEIYRWRKELRIDGKKAFPGNGNLRDEELARLRKENAYLREERDILRKAVAIFSKPPK
jgi:transposase